jgi:hypothetical protein
MEFSWLPLQCHQCLTQPIPYSPPRSDQEVTFVFTLGERSKHVVQEVVNSLINTFINAPRFQGQFEETKLNIHDESL